MITKVKVDYREAMGIKEPYTLYLSEREIALEEVIDRWFAENREYYKVKAEEDCIYILCHHHNEDSWELTLFERRGLILDDDANVFKHSFRGKV